MDQEPEKRIIDDIGALELAVNSTNRRPKAEDKVQAVMLVDKGAQRPQPQPSPPPPPVRK